MKIYGIQKNQLTFNAKLRILGKYFVANEYKNIIKKADKIGYENDIIELNYLNYKDKSIEFLGEKNDNRINKITDIFKARFIPNGEGEGTELYKENIAADYYKDFWKKENAAANKYLDKLFEKYPNERIGVSIIEN